MNSKGIIKNSIILASAAMISKFLGFLFKVPLTRMIGAEGFGLYSYPYLIYTAIIALSTFGLPVVLSKLIAEKVALHRYSEANKIFKVTLVFMTIMGILSTFIMYFLARYLAGHIWPTRALIPLMGLLFAPFFVAILSVFRGYFQGMQMMYAYSISQIAESFTRFVIGLYLAKLLLDRGVEYAAAGGSFGATAGAIIGCITLLIFYFYKRRDFLSRKDDFMAQEDVSSNKEIIHNLLKPLIPVSIAALAITIMPLIDSLIVKNSLLTAGFIERESTMMFGSLVAVSTLINFPLTISYAISITLVPSISNSSAKKNHEDRSKILSDAMRMGFYIMIPAAFGMYMLANEIMHFTFPDIKNAIWILRLSTISIVVMSLNQIVVATLQGLGLFMKPVKNTFIGAFIKILISYTLMRIPAINIHGAIIGTIVGYTVTTYRSSKSLMVEEVLKIAYFKHLIKPIFSSLIMTIFILLAKYYLSLSLIPIVILSVIIYVLSMDIMGAISIKKIISKLLKSASFN